MGLMNKLRRKKIGFWAGDQNNFQFLDPLIDGLSQFYKVKKFDYVDDNDGLHNELDSVDLAWFEWGNGPIVPASHMVSKTPIINRIHRYEVYTDTPSHINWQNVSKTIFSSPSMIVRFKGKFPELNRIAKPELVEIGVDAGLFKFVDKDISKQLIYVGRIHPHKNPSLLLQIFAKLIKGDPEYKLTIIGAFSDELYEEYFFDQVNKLKLKDNLDFKGKLTQPEIVKFYQGADFFLITSIIEGLSQASLEAMACGVRPVIFNYFGSEKGYPSKYIYGTVDEAVQMIQNPVGTRQESRNLIEQSHRLEDKVERIRQIIEDIVG